MFRWPKRSANRVLYNFGDYFEILEEAFQE